MQDPPAAIGQMLEGFRSPDAEVRDRTARTLVRLGRPAAEALTGLLDQSDEAARALVAMGGAAVPALADAAAQGERPSLSWKAATALTRIGEPAVGEIIRRLESVPASGHAETLVFALGEIGAQLGARCQQAVMPCLLHLLRSPDANVGLMAATELEKNAAFAAEVIDELVRLLVEIDREKATVHPGRGTKDLRRLEQSGQRRRLAERLVAVLERIGRDAVPALAEAWEREHGQAPHVHRALAAVARADPAVAPLLPRNFDAAGGTIRPARMHPVPGAVRPAVAGYASFDLEEKSGSFYLGMLIGALMVLLGLATVVFGILPAMNQTHG